MGAKLRPAMEVERPPAISEEELRLPPRPAPEAAAQKMQILTTEHFTLLNARALSWNESFSRVSMFVSVLTGSVVALALIAQAARFGATFLVVATMILTVDLVLGILTIARLVAINEEDVRWTMGMNRLRHRYLELHSDLAPYFITGSTDDRAGLAASLGWRLAERGPVGRLAHGSTSLPGMLGMLVSAIAGVIAALLAISAQLRLGAILLLAVAAAVVTAWSLTIYARHAFARFMAAMPPAFPSDPRP